MGVEESAKTARNVAVGGGAIVVFGVVLYLLWKILKPVGDAAKNVADTAKALTQTAESAAVGLQNAASSLPTVGQSAGNFAEGVAGILPGGSVSYALPSASDFIGPGAPTLVMAIESVDNSRGDFFNNQRTVYLAVKDQSGNPVLGVAVTAQITNPLARLGYANLGQIVDFTDLSGKVQFTIKYGLSNGVTSFPSVEFTAKKSGYNPSNTVDLT